MIQEDYLTTEFELTPQNDCGGDKVTMEDFYKSNIVTNNNFITEDYCSYEMSKLLKKKGCPLEKVIKQDGRPIYYTLPKKHPDWQDCDAYYIPTQAQAMKWLREKGYNIYVDYNTKFGLWYRHIQELSTNVVWSLGGFDTYEEAVEAAIRWSLNNLI